MHIVIKETSHNQRKQFYGNGRYMLPANVTKHLKVNSLFSNCVLFTRSEQLQVGLEKNSNPFLPLVKQLTNGSRACLSLHFLSQNHNLVSKQFAWTLPIRQVSAKTYLPDWKIQLSQANRQHFFWPLKNCLNLL